MVKDADEIKKGDLIAADYTGKLESGEVFDSSIHESHSHPLIFKAGEGQMIKGFDEAVIGMKNGESKTISLNPEEAYGQVKTEMVRKFPRDSIPKEAKQGDRLFVKAPSGHGMEVTIKELNEKEATIDFNHPLAGKKLIFEIKIIAIGEEEVSKIEQHHH